MCGCFENYSIFLQVLLGCGIVVGYCLCLYFGFASLLNISITGRVVLAVTFQEVDAAPHAQAAAQGDHQSLQYVDSVSEKIHKSYFLSSL